MPLIIGLSILGILGAIIAGMSGGGNSKNANSDHKMSDSINSGSNPNANYLSMMNNIDQQSQNHNHDVDYGYFDSNNWH